MDAQTLQPPLTGKRKPARRTPRKWLPYVGGAFLLALIVFGLWPRPIDVETAKVHRGPLRESINEEGKTRIRQRFLVSAPVGGQLRRIPFKAGMEVKSNETVLAVIDPLTPTILDARTRALAEARRDVAKATLDRARAAHEFAQTELRRAVRLAADKTISAQELETVQWRETAAAKEAAAAESSLREAEAELLDSTGLSSTNAIRTPVQIKAPATGKVLKVIEESARVVSPGMALMEIGDPASIEVVIEVLSRDGATLAAGTPVELDQWGGSEPLHARVRHVEPAAFTKISALGVEEQRVNVVADLVDAPPAAAQVGDNFRVEARIIVWETKDTLKAPSGAVFRRNGQPTAFVVSGGTARLRPLKTGHTSGSEVEVLDGLKEGEEVIVYPGDRIHEGTRTKGLRIGQ